MLLLGVSATRGGHLTNRFVGAALILKPLFALRVDQPQVGSSLSRGLATLFKLLKGFWRMVEVSHSFLPYHG